MTTAPPPAATSETPPREALAGTSWSLSSGVELETMDAVQCEIGWPDGDISARIEGLELLKHMEESGWRTISRLGLQPWDKRWTATMYLPRYFHFGDPSKSQQELLDASMMAYRGHADHIRMQWLSDQCNWPAVGLKIDKSVYGHGPNVRALIDSLMAANLSSANSENA